MPRLVHKVFSLAKSTNILFLLKWSNEIVYRYMVWHLGGMLSCVTIGVVIDVGRFRPISLA